jgi:hypothetical protein
VAQKRLGELLLEKKLVSSHDLDRALLEHQRWGGPLGGYLVAMGIIREQVLIKVVAEQLELPFVDLDEAPIDVQVAQLLPRDVCERYNLIAFRLDPQRRFVDIAMSDPLSLEASNALRRITRVKINHFIAGPRAISRAVNRIFFADVAEDSPPTTGPAVMLPSLPESLPSIAAPDVAAVLRPVTTPEAVVSPPPPPPPRGGADAVRPGLEGGAADLVAERMRRLEVGLRRAERTIQVLVELLVERGDVTFPQVAERIGRSRNDSAVYQVTDSVAGAPVAGGRSRAGGGSGADQ